MSIYKIQSPVIVFKHDEYGERLIFQQGETNPRNELGKNGVTIHQALDAFFYRTIKIQAAQVRENGQQEDREFILNRNSLIKYIGNTASPEDADDLLIKKLEAKLWHSNLNQPTQSDKAKQNNAGEHLRHAGQHNKRLIHHWSDSINDFLKGSFLSWFYQATIRNAYSIKARFLLYGTEKKIFETGEILAKKRFHEAYMMLPVYKQHLQTFNGMPVANTRFCDIPVTTKGNYIKNQAYDADTHFYGKYPVNGKTDTSTGTTGKPTPWVRSESELATVKKSLELAAKIQFGNRKLHHINAFALGPWATGLTTYEVMRQTGSVFATGPDKEKILDELLRIAKYEKHQLDLAIDKFQETCPNFLVDGHKVIAAVITNTLKVLLKNRDLSLSQVLNAQIAELPTIQKNFMLLHQDKIKTIVETLNQEKKQILIAGYPPFLKDLAIFVANQGYDLAEFSVIGIIGGQAISEAMRDLLIHKGFNEIFSTYGASDLDINLGMETEYETIVRKTIEKNPGLARELYGVNKGLPMVFHYDPWNYHVECLDEDVQHPENKDSLVFTATRNDRSSPRIRYDLEDKGRVYASSDVQALLAKYGVFQKPKTNLPLMFIWGRDSTVIFNGANVAFTELERAVSDTDLKDEILKKAFYTYHDQEGVERFEVWLELNEGVDIPENKEAYAQNLLAKLASLNQDFRYQLEKLDPETLLPSVRFFKRGQSPISEAGGHRKQVLVFQKENLPKDYVFPNQENCREVTLKMHSEFFDKEFSKNNLK